MVSCYILYVIFHFLGPAVPPPPKGGSNKHFLEDFAIGLRIWLFLEQTAIGSIPAREKYHQNRAYQYFCRVWEGPIRAYHYFCSVWEGLIRAYHYFCNVWEGLIRAYHYFCNVFASFFRESRLKCMKMEDFL